MTDHKTATTLIHAGLHPAENHGIVNPPVYHCSTVISQSLAELEARDHEPFDRVNYGRIGTPTTFAFEEAVTALEGGHRSVAVGSGLAAITLVLTAFARAGGHILVTDSAYAPVRRYCEGTLKRFGVDVEYYDPHLAGGIAALIRPETTLVYCESPGSLTFEVQDIPAIAAAAHARGVPVAMDNTWATPLHFRALYHGVDVSIHAATKYIVGHADTMMGVAVCNEETWEPVKRAAVGIGHNAAPDDVYLALRGLRTLAVRLRQHEASALTLAEWLATRPEVAEVIHPARSDHPDHALWRRDFTGSCGLFAIRLNPVGKPAVAAMLDGLSVFGLGYSWGGFESLIVPANPRPIRSAVPWVAEGPLLRLHAGLEDVDDMIADLDAGFARLAASV